jgi:hypothetical protein
MTESSPSAQSTTLPLRSLQEILHNRIIQKKGEITRLKIEHIQITYGER